MGALLSEPITAMVVERCTCESWSASSVSMQGWRKTHEDAHIFECSCEGPDPAGIFVVLDGHGGKAAACHSRDILKELLVPVMQRGTIDSTTAANELRRIFIAADERLRTKLSLEDKSGTTVVAGIVTRTSSNQYCIHVAHAGDSRALICTAGKVFASEDHKPSRTDETARIRAAGGFVGHGAFGGGPLRVDGSLAVSRAFGDFHFKPNDTAPEAWKVTPVPEVNTVFAEPGDWMLIACDGIFDVFSNDEARDFISTRLPDGAITDGAVVGQDLIRSCLSKGSKDNCTAMLIQLRPNCELLPYERILNMGDYNQAQSAEIVRKYREFFEAEGFAELADHSRITPQENTTSVSAGVQANGNLSSVTSTQQASPSNVAPSSDQLSAVTQALKAMKSSRQIQTAWRNHKSKSNNDE